MEGITEIKKEVKHMTIKATFANGDSLVARINATEEEARAYYVGKMFNVGTIEDNMQQCIGVEILSK